MDLALDSFLAIIFVVSPAVRPGLRLGRRCTGRVGSGGFGQGRHGRHGRGDGDVAGRASSDGGKQVGKGSYPFFCLALLEVVVLRTAFHGEVVVSSWVGLPMYMGVLFFFFSSVKSPSKFR